MAYMGAVRTADHGLNDRLSAYVKAIKDAYARRRLYSRTLAELRALSDRDLADLGIHRSMIRRLALEAANGN